MIMIFEDLHTFGQWVDLMWLFPYFILCPLYEMQKANAPTKVGILW